ncbi:MAG: hypothetical protein V1928_05250 [Parcubacteria group bacterium]
MKKCAKCGAPLEGFFAKIASLAGVKPSNVNPDLCNKCDAQPVVPAVAVQPQAPVIQPEPMAVPTETVEPVKTDLPADAMPDTAPVNEKKDDNLAV